MKKFLILCATALFLPLMAAVDGSKSYFRVSTHQPGVNIPVKIRIFLRDGNGSPCDAKLKSTPAAEITRVKKGEYHCEMVFTKKGEKITPQIFAGKTPIQENLLPELPLTSFASGYTNRRGLVELAHENGRLRIINLSEGRVNASWSFGTIDKADYLPDRRYRFSGNIESSDIRKGRGAALYLTGRDAKGKSVSGRYSKFIRNTREFVDATQNPRHNAVSGGLGFSMNNCDGKACISDVRLAIVPTFIVQDKPGITVKLQPGKKQLRVSKNYAAAIAPYKKQLDAVVTRANANGVKAETINLPRTISAEKALKLKLEMLDRIKSIEKLETDAQKKKLEMGFVPSPLKLLAPNVRALVANRGKKPAGFETKFYIYRKSGNVVPAAFGCSYDDENFYVEFRVPGKPNIHKGTGVHDDRTLWNVFGDKVEIFINKPGTRGYSHFASGPGGQKYDEAEGDSFVNYNWTVKSEVKPDGVKHFFTIPWKELDIDPAKNKELRMNFIITKGTSHRNRSAYVWSFANAGFREYDSMGFVVLDKYPAGVTDYIAWKNNEIKKEYELANRNAAESAKKMRSNKVTALSFNWDEDQSYEKDPAIQMRLIGKYIASPAPAKLNFRIAGNEFAHRAFAVAAIKGDLDAKVVFSDLKSTDGKVIPKANLSLTRTLFLEPRADIYPKFRQKWSGRPLPELFETVEDSTRIERFSVAQFRLYIDSRKCAPGKYSGSFTIGGITVPVQCEIVDFALPPCEDKPIHCNIFTNLPWGGKSGDAWGKFFQEHYVGDVSFEHPRIFVDNVHVNCSRSCRCNPAGVAAVLPDFKDGKYKGMAWRGETWDGYRQAVVDYRTPKGAKVTFDGKLYDFDDRIRACARWNLRIVLSNRNGFMFVDHMPLLAEYLEKLGLPRANFVYKLGDEDHAPYFLTVAKEIRKRVPGINVTMIPSGAKYWDLKPLMEGFTCMEYSAGAFNVNEQGRKDLQYMRSKGFPIRRYTNRTSWAERQPILAGRRDLWDVVIKENLDGMTVWTASPRPPERYSLGYGCNKAVNWPEIPPENQHLCQLVYWRKQGDFFKPIASLRLEELRDGVTDSLYYREALKRLTARNDKAGLDQLNKIVERPKLKFSDYENARAEMLQLILKK